MICLGAFACLLTLTQLLVAETQKTQSKKGPTFSDQVENEFQKLLADDDAAQAEADKWIREAKAFEEAGAGVPSATLTPKIDRRLSSVRKAYEDFLRRYPNHARARLAYGSFLNDIHEEEAAIVQWEKAKEIDPTNPAAWNNLANHYGHRGPIKKAFEHYEKAIELDGDEPVYLQNLATTTYLFRDDAKEFYKLTDQQVYDRALDLYRRAIKLDPENFPLATDYAQTFYGIRPMRVAEAIEAWNYALKVANDDIERQGVCLHLARIQLNSGRFDEARRNLAAVTHEMYQVLKNRLNRNLSEKENKTKASAAAATSSPSTPTTVNAPPP